MSVFHPSLISVLALLRRGDLAEENCIISIDKDGFMFVCDSDNSRIQVHVLGTVLFQYRDLCLV